jgi:hypothetical protein
LPTNGFPEIAHSTEPGNVANVRSGTILPTILRCQSPELVHRALLPRETPSAWILFTIVASRMIIKIVDIQIDIKLGPTGMKTADHNRHKYDALKKKPRRDSRKRSEGTYVSSFQTIFS